MLEHLITESSNPQSDRIDSGSSLDIVRLMNSEDVCVTAAVERELPAIATAVDRIVHVFQQGGRLIYLGAGTSGRLGVLDASECPPTFNSPPGQVVGLIAGGPSALTQSIEGAEDQPEQALRDLRHIGLSKNDILVGIATSGRTPYVLSGLEFARRIGTETIGICCNENAPLSTLSDTAITPIVGPEIISGSTRLKAGTATKMILNMLTTASMIRNGKTFGNLMVDLRATNGKLVERSRRIITRITGLDPQSAKRLLEECGGEVKTAIACHQLGIDPDKARTRLRAVSGHLRRVLENANPDDEEE